MTQYAIGINRNDYSIVVLVLGWSIHLQLGEK